MLDRIQSMLNAAAKKVDIGKTEIRPHYITPLLRNLHWPERIKFQLACTPLPLSQQHNAGVLDLNWAGDNNSQQGL